MSKTTGTLYVVATPIGHLSDLSARAIETLRQVDLIAAEDTRHSRHLLQHFQIDTPLISLHEHNEKERTTQLLHKLQAGQHIALISDAGTPLISDPGYCLIHTLREAKIRIVPLPGACALIAALCASGLPSDRFSFEGFLPAKSSKRRNYLENLQQETRTMIFYEAPHRILETIDDLIHVFGTAREACLARELTKTFETILTASLSELKAQLVADPQQQRGEFVVLVKGAMPAEAQETASPEAQHILKTLAEELPLKQAVSLTAKITGERKNQLYDWALGAKVGK